MTIRPLRILAFACSLSLLSSTAVSADPFGGVSFGEWGLLSPIVYDDGRFAFTGWTYDPVVENPVGRCNGGPHVCVPGAMLNLDTSFQLFGNSLFDGITTHVGGPMDNADAWITLTGSTELPNTSLPWQTTQPWSTPIEWALVAHLPRQDGTGLNMGYENSGSGTLTFGLGLNTGNPVYPESFRMDVADLTLTGVPMVAHTPEPGTWLLLGTGLMGVVARWRRRIHGGFTGAFRKPPDRVIL